MRGKLQVRDFLQDYRIVMNRIFGGKDFNTLDFIVLKMHHSTVNYKNSHFENKYKKD